MPVTFDPDHLRDSLRPLSDAQPLSAEARVYQRFYGLDLPARKVPAVSRLGRFEVDGFDVVAQVWWPPADTATAVRPVPRSIGVDEGASVSPPAPSPNCP